MKKSNYKILMLLSAMFVFSIVFALTGNAKAGQSVDCNLTLPTMRNGTQGNVSYNLSIAAGDFVESVSAAIFVSSPSTANSSDSLIMNTSNSSNRNHINFTFVDGKDIIEDSNDYTAYAICYLNGTSSKGAGIYVGNSTALTSRSIQRTKPNLPTGIVPTGTQTNNTLDIVTTINAANTSRCILEFIDVIPNGASRINTMTESGNICSARYTSVSDKTYQYVITATDGENSTSPITSYIKIETDEVNLQALGVLNQVVVKQQTQQKKNNNNMFFLIVVVVVVAAIITNKKSRR